MKSATWFGSSVMALGETASELTVGVGLPPPRAQVHLRHLPPKPLVAVVVPRDGDLGPEVVQPLPQRLHCGIAAVHTPRAEAGIVHVGQRALLGAGRQVCTQPLLLRRAGAHVDEGVEHDDMPRAEVVAVVVVPAVADDGAVLTKEVAIVVGRAGRDRVMVLVVARRAADDRLILPP